MDVDEIVIELVGVLEDRWQGAGHRVVAVDDLHVEGVEPSVPGPLAPEVRHELLVLRPPVPVVVRRVDDDDAQSCAYGLEERGLRRLTPARAVVVEDDRVQRFEGVLIGEGLARSPCDRDLEATALAEDRREGRSGPLPVVVVRPGDDEDLGGFGRSGEREADDGEEERGEECHAVRLPPRLRVRSLPGGGAAHRARGPTE